MLDRLAVPCGAKADPLVDGCSDRCRSLVAVESILERSHLCVEDAVLGSLIDEVNRRFVVAAVVAAAVALEAIAGAAGRYSCPEYDSTLHQDFVEEVEATGDSQDAADTEDDRRGVLPAVQRDYASADTVRGYLAGLVDLAG